MSSYSRPSISRRVRLVVIVSAVLACGALTPSARAAAGPVTEDSPANDLALTLNTIGEADYATTFAGVMPTDSSDVTVYTVGDASAFLAYADALAGSSVTITDETVSRSISELAAITSQITADVPTFAASGIELQSWGPVPSQDDVAVTLAASTDNVAAPAYLAQAQAAFDSALGTGNVTVAKQPQSLPQADAAGRDSDIAPYTGGDGITVSEYGDSCTDSWETKDAQGHIRVLSAGHCGTGTVSLAQGTTLGTVYIHDVGSDYDFEGISANEQDKIWKNATSRYTVIGSEDPGIGSTLTVNGDVSGEHGDLEVVAQDECTSFILKNGQGTIIVCGIGEVTSSTSVCADGDSGGPAYHSSGSDVDAAGTIEGSNNGGKNCFFESVTREMSHADLTLVTS
jgi:hypothetical protein